MQTEIALVPNWSWYQKRPVPNWICPRTELDTYRSGHVVPNKYFLEPKWYVPNVTATQRDLPLYFDSWEHLYMVLWYAVAQLQALFLQNEYQLH